MRKPLIALAILVLTACAAPTAVGEQPQTTSPAAPATSEPISAAGPASPALPDLGPAPEITNDIWLNAEAPVTLAALHGQKAVVVTFWTFG